MAKKEYGWKLGEEPPVIDLHSITKHRVYEEYLMHYIQVLNSNPLIPEFNLNVVDGFSGGGEYLHPTTNHIYDGSPVKLINAAEAAEAAINVRREAEGVRKKFVLNTKFFFVESKKSNFEYLEECLNRHGFIDKYGEKILRIKSTFSEEVEKIILEIRRQDNSHRSLFILDQYGYSDVPFEDIKKIFKQLPNAEVILTFATDWLIDYLSNKPEYIKGLKKSGLDEVLDVARLVEYKEDNDDWRRIVQYELHKAILLLSGAKFYTPFFIVSNESNRSFLLVHLSNHPKARDVMTELHWSIKNHFTHYGDRGFKMFGYNPKQDQVLSGIEDMFSNTEYSFDELANKQTLESIVSEMPALIFEYNDGITYGDFFKMVTNYTPATDGHIKRSAEILIDGKELEIISPDGKRRFSANTIKNEDIVRLPKQPMLITTGGDKLVGLNKKKKDSKKGNKK